MFGISLGYIIAVVALLLVVVVGSALLFRRSRKPRDGQSLYISALRSLLDGNEVQAFYELKEVVSQNSENIDAYLRLGRILLSRGKVTEAIDIHSDLLLRMSLTESDTKAIFKAMIDDYTVAGDTEKALEILNRLFERDRSNRDVGERLIELLLQEKRWSDVEQVAEKLYKYDRQGYAPQFAEVKVRIGDTLAAEGNYKKARTLYKAAAALDPGAGRAWVKIGDTYLAENRTEDAVKSWRHLTEALPRQAHLVIERLRKALFDLGQFNTISGLLESILENDPDNIDASMALARHASSKGEHSQAEELYRHVLADEPDYPPAVWGIAKIYREQGRTDEAFDLLSKLLEDEETVGQKGW